MNVLLTIHQVLQLSLPFLPLHPAIFLQLFLPLLLLLQHLPHIFPILPLYLHPLPLHPLHHLHPLHLLILLRPLPPLPLTNCSKEERALSLLHVRFSPQDRQRQQLQVVDLLQQDQEEQREHQIDAGVQRQLQHQ